GHISLVERARRENDFVVVSVFVNPTQFNNETDLMTYPRTEDADCSLLGRAGVDVAFIPEVQEMYPEPDSRQFDLGEVAAVMEGPRRPGHFNGVAQVVSKQFMFSQPTRAYFGEKDFQQIAVIKRMVEIEGFDIEIVDCPIKRADDGLALSSRNVRLTPSQRAVAPMIHRIMADSVADAAGKSVMQVRQEVIDAVNAVPEMKVEYYEIVHPVTMQPVVDWNDSPVGCITVYCGDVRLIDNIKYPKQHESC
ncbi:MAG: pantoate--beta-alanine ligase, partial [Muribaculaceae bacterium]|nr:pantoate--beta-alanine ligase [Muribaculaceae bacterium]